MPDSLVDLGGGVKMADPSNFIGEVKPIDPMERLSKTLQLKDLLREDELAPIRESKLRAETAKSQQDAMRNIALSAMSGDTEGATRGLWMQRPDMAGKVSVMLSVDPEQAAQGIVDVVNVETGELLASLNPMKEEQLKKNINVRGDLFKDLTNKRWDKIINDEKLFAQTIKEISEKNGISPREAQFVAAEYMDIAKTNQSDSLLGKRPNFVKQVSEREFGNAQANKELVDAIMDKYKNVSFRNKEPLTPEQLKEHKDTLTAVQNLNEKIIPTFQAMSKNGILSRPGIVGGTVGNIMNKIGAGDPNFASLKSLVNSSVYDAVLKYAATTFTPKTKEEIAKMIPKETDPIEVAIAKASAISTMLLTSGNNALDTWDNSGRFVPKELKRMLDPNSGSMFVQKGSVNNLFGSIDRNNQDKVADGIISFLPKELLNNPKFISAYSDKFPPEFKDKFNQKLIDKGYVLGSEDVVSKATKLMNLQD